MRQPGIAKRVRAAACALLTLASFGAASSSALAGNFSGQHFSNASLSGSPTNTSSTSSINYNWGSGAPAGLPSDFFSNRWSATVPTRSGTYTFHVRADDGVRLYVDGALVIDGWERQTATDGTYSASRTLSQGNHTIVLEHYEHDGVSSISLEWEVPGASGDREPITGIGDPPANVPTEVVLNKPLCKMDFVQSRVSLRWSGGVGGTAYHVLRRSVPSSLSWSQVDFFYTATGNNLTSCSFPVDDVITKYEYKVTASNGSGYSTGGNSVHVPELFQPSSFTLSGTQTGYDVSLSWTGDSSNSGPISYEVKRRPKGSTQDWSGVANLGTTSARTFNYTSESKTSFYDYAVVASNYSPWKTTSNVVTLPLPKTWSVGTGIGVYKDANGVTQQNGRILSPLTEAGKSEITVLPGQVIPCSVETASDFDSWSFAGETGTDEDVIADPDNYEWRISGCSTCGSGQGFRRAGSNDVPVNAIRGRDVEFVVSPTAIADHTISIECIITNFNGKNLAADEKGTRFDRDRVQYRTFRIAKTWAEIKLYRKTANSTNYDAAKYEELDLSKPIGGEVFVGLHLNLGAGQKVVSDKCRVRIHELPDVVNDVNHIDKEDRIEASFALNDNAGWQKYGQPSGKNLGWWSSSTSPASSSHTAPLTQYRYLISWKTFEQKTGSYRLGTSTTSSKLWGHNGAHEISLEWVDDVQGAPIVYSPTIVNQSAASLKKTVDVHNLVITDVATSNGTSDYFKFDPESTESSLRNPSISFSIEDKGQANRYQWWLWVKPSRGEQNSIAFSGILAQPGTQNVTVNQLGYGYTQDRNLTEWGTYTFELRVKEIETNSTVGIGEDWVDYHSEKLYIPVNYSVSGKNFPGHKLEFMSEDREDTTKAKVSYYLSGTQNASSGKVDFLNEDMTVKATVPMQLEIKIPRQGIELYTLNQNDIGGVNRAFFTAMDSHASEYRDHKNRPMKPVNQLGAFKTFHIEDDWMVDPAGYNLNPQGRQSVVSNAFYQTGWAMATAVTDSKHIHSNDCAEVPFMAELSNSTSPDRTQYSYDNFQNYFRRNKPTDSVKAHDAARYIHVVGAATETNAATDVYGMASSGNQPLEHLKRRYSYVYVKTLMGNRVTNPTGVLWPIIKTTIHEMGHQFGTQDDHTDISGEKYSLIAEENKWITEALGKDVVVKNQAIQKLAKYRGRLDLPSYISAASDLRDYKICVGDSGFPSEKSDHLFCSYHRAIIRGYSGW